MNLVPAKQPENDSQRSTGKRKILYWQAPMDPTEIYDHPGKSRMGMDLVPVYEDQVMSGRTVVIDPATVQKMGVRTVAVRKTEFRREIRTVGVVKFNEEKVYTISARISGWVEKLYVNATGEMIRPGDPLLAIYSPDLVTTQQEYLLALQNLRQVRSSSLATLHQSAESLLRSARERFRNWGISDQEIQQLKETGVVRKTLPLVSPYRGVVLQKNVQEGAFVKEGSLLYRIADLSTVWVLVSIYDNELPWISPDQPVEMELSYLPGKRYRGKVQYIYPYLDEKSREVRLRVQFPNPALDLKPGMYTTVYLSGKPIPDALVVPAEAVLRTGKRNIVFVVRGAGKFEPREVRIGEEDGRGNLRILSGLLEGETIVRSGQFLLDSESRLQEAIRKLLEEAATPDSPKSKSPPMSGER
jgi:Cu(I)/Ag(I) efflux system membrane fusion protein/cobalt-zinc-cadmium efflux system membrane fusion protein